MWLLQIELSLAFKIYTELTGTIQDIIVKNGFGGKLVSLHSLKNF